MTNEKYQRIESPCRVRLCNFLSNLSCNDLTSVCAHRVWVFGNGTPLTTLFLMSFTFDHWVGLYCWPVFFIPTLPLPILFEIAFCLLECIIWKTYWTKNWNKILFLLVTIPTRGSGQNVGKRTWLLQGRMRFATRYDEETPYCAFFSRKEEGRQRRKGKGKLIA